MQKQYTNHLINEASPYLLQHAHNPVNWYPWGNEALLKAKEEDKLLLISIGYAACHWCHVMEKESFEDEEIAGIMNENYLCIKVDREERPDIDQIYLEAIQMMGGRGGWPLNCFALPDGRPVYGGTYYQPKQWKQILLGLAISYKTDKSRFHEFAGELVNGMNKNDIIDLKPLSDTFSPKLLKEIVEPWKKLFDNREGGNKGAPKFPMPNALFFLLYYSYFSKDLEVMDHVHLTLDKMGKGGIYDQVGGGFARYSVDERWHVPHFEKMLYDNAQLISLYAIAYRQNKNEDYKRIVYQIVEFINRELSSPEGGFYSSLDADSEGEEGLYYVWNRRQLEKILGNEAGLYCEYYHIAHEGNWERKKNIPYRTDNLDELAEKHHITKEEILSKITTLNEKVLKVREKRIRPGLDDKILASWNALMIKGLTDAYQTFGDSRFLERAIQNANFIKTRLIDSDNKILRSFRNGKVSIDGFLDDYACIIDAFIHLYQSTFDEQWLQKAKNICDYAFKHFFNQDSGMFYYTSDLDEELICRKTEIHDNVIPSSNSVMANNLFVLGYYFQNGMYSKTALQMLANIKDEIKHSGTYYSNWAILLTKYIFPPAEVVIIGTDAEKLRASISCCFLPSVILAGSVDTSDLPVLQNKKAEAKTLIYVCRNRVCDLPVYSAEDAIKQIHAD